MLETAIHNRAQQLGLQHEILEVGSVNTHVVTPDYADVVPNAFSKPQSTHRVAMTKMEKSKGDYISCALVPIDQDRSR